jgi:hypothetical protein
MQKTQKEKKNTGKRKTIFERFRWRGRRKVQRQVKDRLFRFVFEKDKEALLQLYNALNGTDYQDAEQLEVVTIENAVYVVMKNDLAFMIAGTLNLYEHQSTYNPNMPVRFLIYLAEEYQKIVEQEKHSLYGRRKIMLPTPQCVVLYNGEEDMPEECTLCLSDSFGNRKEQSDVELKVRMLNINYGHNQALMDKCRMLEEYAEFIAISRQYASEGKDMQEAMNTAVEYCIDHGILSGLLRQNRTEVLGMLLEEFDVEKYERTLRSEGREDGFREGREDGVRETSENYIRKMLMKGMTAEQIADILEIPIERVEHVQTGK